MSSYVLWLDHEHSKLFDLKPAGATLHSSKQNKEHSKGDTEKFFHEIAHSIQGAKELLVVGPGLAKTHFKAHLERHHHKDLATKVVGIENMDHPTDPQILAEARRFFKDWDQFH